MSRAITPIRLMSIRQRLLIVAGGVLTVFVLATGFALERAFVNAATQGEQDKLKGLVYALLGAANIGTKGVTVDLSQLGEPRLLQPGSGLDAMIVSSDGSVVWRSPSMLEQPPPALLPPPGQWAFDRIVWNGGAWFRLSFGVRWAAGSPVGAYDFMVLESTGDFSRQMAGYRRVLWSWLAAAALLLLLALLAVMQWGLAPLKRVSDELRRIESGDAEILSGDHPRELQPLVEAINALLAHEKARRERSRHALDDLAHSLKTPLAVLRGLRAEDGLGGAAAKTVGEQVERMDKIVAFQLQRAEGARVQALLPPLALAPVVGRLASALERVYAQKGIRIRSEIPPSLHARIDENQLMELVGNLLDNAAKWASVRVRVSARRTDIGLYLWVEDDGPGMAVADAERLLARGERADTLHPGQGIGLAVVAQIAADYGGDVRIERSELGGAKVEVYLRTA